jgi:hypothetical protein
MSKACTDERVPTTSRSCEEDESRAIPKEVTGRLKWNCRTLVPSCTRTRPPVEAQASEGAPDSEVRDTTKPGEIESLK